MDYTRDAIQTIKKNAGRVPPAEIAATLGWTVPQLERIAAKHEIPLRLFIRDAATPESDPRRPNPHYSHKHTRVAPDKLRSIQVTCNLRKANVSTIDQVAAERFLKRSRVAMYIIEGALARGIVDDLVNAALDADREESPDAEPQVG